MAHFTPSFCVDVKKIRHLFEDIEIIAIFAWDE